MVLSLQIHGHRINHKIDSAFPTEHTYDALRGHHWQVSVDAAALIFLVAPRVRTRNRKCSDGTFSKIVNPTDSRRALFATAGQVGLE